MHGAAITRSRPHGRPAPWLGLADDITPNVFLPSHNELRPSWSEKWTLERTPAWKEKMKETIFGENLLDEYFFSSTHICWHGGGGVYDLYCSLTPGGDVLAPLLRRCHIFLLYTVSGFTCNWVTWSWNISTAVRWIVMTFGSHIHGFCKCLLCCHCCVHTDWRCNVWSECKLNTSPAHLQRSGHMIGHCCCHSQIDWQINTGANNVLHFYSILPYYLVCQKRQS